MIRRNKRYQGLPSRDLNPQYSPSQTSQVEPNLHEILVAYQRGEDISQFVTLSAAKATAEQQFKNRLGKVDPLTEFSDYIKSESKKANDMVRSDKANSKKPLEEDLNSPSPSEQKE